MAFLISLFICGLRLPMTTLFVFGGVAIQNGCKNMIKIMVN